MVHTYFVHTSEHLKLCGLERCGICIGGSESYNVVGSALKARPGGTIPPLGPSILRRVGVSVPTLHS
jgi:hypothetical protein